jgi:hypothetical protein
VQSYRRLESCCADCDRIERAGAQLDEKGGALCGRCAVDGCVRVGAERQKLDLLNRQVEGVSQGGVECGICDGSFFEHGGMFSR